jgi:hypothetical protein
LAARPLIPPRVVGTDAVTWLGENFGSRIWRDSRFALCRPAGVGFALCPEPGASPRLSSVGLSALQFGFASQLRLVGSLAPRSAFTVGENWADIIKGPAFPPDLLSQTQPKHFHQNHASLAEGLSVWRVIPKLGDSLSA